MHALSAVRVNARESTRYSRKVAGKHFKCNRYDPRPEIGIIRLKGRRENALRGKGVF